MERVRLSSLAARFTGICLCVSLAACADPRVKAAGELEAEMAARHARRARSEDLLAQAAKAVERSDLSAARRCLDESLAADAQNAHAWMALGALEFGQDDICGAAQSFHRAARLEPMRYEPRYNLGIVLESVGKHSEAAKEYEIALERAPDQVEVMENLACCYVRTNTNGDKVRPLVEKALRQEHRPEWVRWLQEQACRLDQQKEKTP